MPGSAHPDDGACRRWICVIGLVFGSTKDFACFLDQLGLRRPRAHAATKPAI
jgi:hypothetical protein